MQLPKLGKIKTEWDLKAHYYSSENDPQIEKDLKKTERAYKAFAKKYAGKDFTSTAKKLLVALEEYETLTNFKENSRPAYYFWLRSTRNAKDSVAEKRLALIENRLSKASNLTLFFSLAISKIPAALQKKYLKDPLLAPYRYDLKSSFESAKHTLTEAEEKILNLKGGVSYGMWVDGTEKILGKKEITWKGKQVPLTTAMESINTLPSAQKPKLWNVITDAYADIKDVAENEMNAVVTNKKINDELRGYKTPYEATIKGYENNEKAVLALVDAVSDKGFKLSQRYYKAVAKQQGKKKIPYANRADSIGKPVKLSFERSVELCRETFYSMHDEYGTIFDRMLTNGSIDVYPTPGKRAGAFCMSTTTIPTFVFLNQVDSTRSFTTLAHEMGHAIHSERSKIQPTWYEDYSTTTAETASTLFEGLALERLFETLPDSQKLAMLNEKIGDQVATICRQIACFNYEKELHETIRREGGMTGDEMAHLMQKHLQSYMGPAVEVTEREGLSFVMWSHTRRFFYVYSYAYGELMSSYMRQQYNADPAYIQKIDHFLTRGGSDTVENIFKSIGINAMKPDTFAAGLNQLEADIKTFEQLVAKK